VYGVDPQAADEQPLVSLPSQIWAIEPNPFTFNQGHGSATIRLSISDRAAHAPLALELVDLNGRLVRNLGRDHVQAGNLNVAWDGRDDAGRPVGAGMYYLRLITAEGRSSARVVVLR
jgi:flagellar hook assembly protein FlgD